jgi:hypothetical protein
MRSLFYGGWSTKDGAIRLLELADHLGSHRRAINRALGSASRRQRHLLARGTAAGAGRYVVVRGTEDGRHTDVTPMPFNARTRVHEYGGGSWTVVDGSVYFSNFSDGRLYRQQRSDTEPQPLTPPPAARERDWRFADGIIDRRRNRWIGVREDHTGEGEPVNAIVTVDLVSGHEPGRILTSGHDFYSSPVVQEGLPDAIPNEACYLGWQESLRNLARLVEP